MPPLRERKNDIVPLADAFIRRFAGELKKRIDALEPDAQKLLMRHNWPGNIRELENLMERMVAVSDGEWITAGHLPYEYHLARLTRPEAASEGLFDRACEMFERNFILRALEQARWNVTATARTLGMPLSTLKFKMDRLDIREIARKLRSTGPA